MPARAGDEVIGTSSPALSSLAADPFRRLDPFEQGHPCLAPDEYEGGSPGGDQWQRQNQ